MKLPDPVAAQHRFRHPQKTMTDWSVWQPTAVKDRPPSTIDSVGYQVEYRNLYSETQVRELLAQADKQMVGKYEPVLRTRQPLLVLGLPSPCGISAD